MKVRYDLHLHTVLSPCGDDDMTPNNIANMAKINGLDVIAVTDHNACGNCRAVASVGKKIGLTVIAGMELETSEEVHVVMLFPSIDDAEACAKEVDSRRFKIKNKADIYGRQLIMDDNDAVLREEENLLVTATDIGVYEVVALAKKYGGIAFPAHIDRQSHGILQMLGDISEDMGFTAVEISKNADEEFVKEWKKKGYKVLRNSDAHYLENIADGDEGENFIELDSVTTQRVLNEFVKR